MAEKLIYGARNIEEQRRNQARLGTRWQEKRLTSRQLRQIEVDAAYDTGWWRGFFVGWLWWK